MEHAKKAAEFLERAEECELIAKLATTDEAKAAYIRMAELYRQLSGEESKLDGLGFAIKACLEERTRQSSLGLDELA